MGGALETYHWVFNEVADPMVKEWPMMGSPIPVVMLVLMYLYAIKVFIPAYMQYRPAYDLKAVIRVYNIFQVFANSIVSYKILTSGWTTTLTLGCEMPDTSTPEGLEMAKWIWWTYILKVIELVETVFFILRKKDNQASLLHIYHHCITLSVMWICVKFVPGGMASFTPLINTFVHVIMYSYYLLASESGPKLRAQLNKWKMWLTIIQMAQFTIVLVHSLQALAPSCPAPRIIVWIYIPNLLMVYYLFYDFFKKTYTKDAKQGKST